MGLLKGLFDLVKPHLFLVLVVLVIGFLVVGAFERGSASKEAAIQARIDAVEQERQTAMEKVSAAEKVAQRANSEKRQADQKAVEAEKQYQADKERMKAEREKLEREKVAWKAQHEAERAAVPEASDQNLARRFEEVAKQDDTESRALPLGIGVFQLNRPALEQARFAQIGQEDWKRATSLEHARVVQVEEESAAMEHRFNLANFRADKCNDLVSKLKDQLAATNQVVVVDEKKDQLQKEQVKVIKRTSFWRKLRPDVGVGLVATMTPEGKFGYGPGVFIGKTF